MSALLSTLPARFRRTLVGLKPSLAAFGSVQREFQTDPRGVEANSTLPCPREDIRFRRTLVGLKRAEDGLGEPYALVSDGPSWG